MLPCCMAGAAHEAVCWQLGFSEPSLTRTIVVVRSQDSRPRISQIIIATCFFLLQTSEMIAPVEQIGQQQLYYAVLVVSALEEPG